uniref:Uncharacterized protein n=1 Tax=Picea sitchensis TaxID=3332 RepID=A9NSN2_PICSI|nr:unknown [Picea sitchensis]
MQEGLFAFVTKIEGEQADPVCTAKLLRKKFRWAKFVSAWVVLLGLLKQTGNTVAMMPSSLCFR